MMAEPDSKLAAAKKKRLESDGIRLVHGAGRGLHDFVTEDVASSSVTSKFDSRYSERRLLNLWIP